MFWWAEVHTRLWRECRRAVKIVDSILLTFADAPRANHRECGVRCGYPIHHKTAPIVGCCFVVGRGGFEPPKSKTSDLQSDPFGRSGICPYIQFCCGAGDWTRTHNLLITNQLLCQLSYTGVWCLEVESNHRQTDFQSVALPTELSRHLWRPRTGSNRRPPA